MKTMANNEFGAWSELDAWMSNTNAGPWGAAYGWDINRGAEDRVDPRSLPKPPVIPIPYRVMVPETAGNLICPGRAVNCERPVLGPMRVQAPIMAMGQAAGTAAAAAIADGRAFRDVDVGRLRTSLADDGAIVSR